MDEPIDTATLTRNARVGQHSYSFAVRAVINETGTPQEFPEVDQAVAASPDPELGNNGIRYRKKMVWEATDVHRFINAKTGQVEVSRVTLKNVRPAYIFAEDLRIGTTALIWL